MKLIPGLIALALSLTGGSTESARFSHGETADCLRAEHLFGKIATSAEEDVIEVTFRRFLPREIVDVAILFDGQPGDAASAKRLIRVENVTLAWREPPDHWARDRIMACLS